MEQLGPPRPTFCRPVDHRQWQRFRRNLQRPCQRATSVFGPAHAYQPARRLGNPRADKQAKQRGHEATGEQPAPTDRRREKRTKHRTKHHAKGDKGRYQPADKTALRGGNKFLNEGQVDTVKPADPEPYKEAEYRHKSPPLVGCQRENARRQREIEHGADKDSAAPDSVGEPAPYRGAEYRTDSGRQQDDRRLAKAQLPRANDESQDEPDQEIIEELQHVAENGGSDDPPLICGQRRRGFQSLEHWHFPDF